jgi:hypothetical protein
MWWKLAWCSSAHSVESGSGSVRPDGDLERAGGVPISVHVDEAQLAVADPEGAVPVKHGGSLAVVERLGRQSLPWSERTAWEEKGRAGSGLLD